jgi:hypothetical protein
VVGGGAGSRAAVKKEEEVAAGRRKMEIGEIIDFFFSDLASDFSSLWPWNPPLFIRDERRTFYL